MDNLLAAYSAITLYMLCTGLMLLHIRQYPPLASVQKITLLIPGFLALAAHGFALYTGMVTTIGINFGFYNALSLVAFMTTLFTLIAVLRHQVEIMFAIVMPLSAAVITLDMTSNSTHLLAPGSSSGLIVHVMVSLVAYSLLGLAALHALVLSVQNRMLHSHHPSGVIGLLPPLKTMETLLFETILVGFICLTISLATGLVFLDNMFAQQLAHKTVLSILAWIVFAILLIGHHYVGWRGKTAIRWTLGGFISLMLAYFGSKFVLEVILV